MSRRRLAAAIVVAAGLASGPASAASEGGRLPPFLEREPRVPDERPRDVPDDAALEAAGAIVGEIEIVSQDIFDTSDPDENNALFRAANALHARTRPHVIARILLVRSGDAYSARLLRESERLLRSQGYLYDAFIEPIRFDGRRVDIRVRTRDVWTLSAGVGFTRKGGKNATRIGIEDSNFLGFGKAILIRHTRDVDRTQTEYRYRDRALAGTRGRLTALYSDKSDGATRSVVLERPFFAIDTRWAVAVAADDDERTVSLYDRGIVVEQFGARRFDADVWYGWGRPSVEGRVRRIRVGVSYEHSEFDPLPGTIEPASVPAGRTLVYPWISVGSVRDAWVERFDLDKIFRTEDLNLSTEYDGSLGLSARAFGGDRDRLVYGASWRTGRAYEGGALLLARAQVSGRLRSRRSENLQVGGTVRFYRRDFGRHLAFVSFGFDAAERLDPELQLPLGGDNGLRGYPLRYAIGDRRVLLTVEQRFYTDWHILQLIRVGSAVFADIGAAWFASGPEAGPIDVLEDVGFGLRLASSRSARAAMLHIDLAFPLDGEGGIRRTQFLVTSKESF